MVRLRLRPETECRALQRSTEASPSPLQAEATTHEQFSLRPDPHERSSPFQAVQNLRTKASPTVLHVMALSSPDKMSLLSAEATQGLKPLLSFWHTQNPLPFSREQMYSRQMR